MERFKSTSILKGRQTLNIHHVLIFRWAKKQKVEKRLPSMERNRKIQEVITSLIAVIVLPRSI